MEMEMEKRCTRILIITMQSVNSQPTQMTADIIAVGGSIQNEHSSFYGQEYNILHCFIYITMSSAFWKRGL